MNSIPPRYRARRRRRSGGFDERSLDALVRHAEEPYRIGVAILAFTGMRLYEALALRWRDIDLVELELHVSGQMSRGTRENPAHFIPRTHDGEPYSTLILPALETELTRRLRAELAEGRGREGDFVLAVPRTGRPPHQRNLQ
jgi:integrase